jgi:acyl-CoA thioesterase
MDRGWWIERGPNGGYVAAVVLRALMAEVGDPGRSPRSMTVHYLAPPAEGPVEVQVTIERSGRSLTFCSARLFQGDRLLATALAAFAPGMDGPSFDDLVPPVVPAPDTLEIMPSRFPDGSLIAMRERYEYRWALGGPPFSEQPDALVGGWIRLREPRPYDAPLIAAITDAWIPPIFTKSSVRMGVPTVDLTIHFRSPVEDLAATDHVLCAFRSKVASNGFVEEDGEVWSADGRLLAQSRQLALLLPLS